MDIKKPEETSRLCASCNSFFGTQASEWLCSGCYKSKNPNTQTHKPSAPVEPRKPELKEEIPRTDTSPRLEQKDKGRCFSCNKKVGLLGIECKCDYVFCNLHRLPEAHECDVDYRKLGQAKLLKENQLVAPSKIAEI